MPGKKKCQGHALHGQRWQKWLCHLKQVSHPRIYIAIYLTNALCLRISQATSLRVTDFQWPKHRVWLRAFKGHKACYKALLPSCRSTIESFKKNGMKNCKGCFRWPSRGYLFPSRRGSKLPYLNKDVVSHAVCAARKSFVAKYKHVWPDLEDACRPIRSHSGRRHAISEHSAANLPMHIGMAWSQISSSRVYAGYVDLNPEAVVQTMRKLDKSRNFGRAD